MELITLKTLTVGMLIGTVITGGVAPVQSTTPIVNTNEIVSAVELGANANIDAPIKAASIAAMNAAEAAKTAQPKKIAVAKPKAETTTASKPVNTPAITKAAIVSGSGYLDSWIEGLIQKESSGKTNIKILDTNNRYSYGCLQFQMPTFIAYGKKYGIISGAESNLESLIMSCSLQKTIAKKMIMDDRDNWRHWYHSVYTRGLGLPPLN